MSLKFAIVTLLLIPLVRKSTCESKDEWVWEKDDNNDRTSRKIDARYEIYEPNFELNGPDPAVIPQGPRPGTPGQLNRPGNYNPQRPSNFGYIPQRYPDRGVLVGPSYGRGPFEYVDRCTCTERFNCRGLAYGSCDVGRQYCCEGRKSGPPPSRPVHSPENGILVGPGGGNGPHPFHHGLHYGNREGYGRDDNPGVLVGPGGPTGVLGRPGKFPSEFGLENGVLTGPNHHQGQYGRSKG